MARRATRSFSAWAKNGAVASASRKVQEFQEGAGLLGNDDPLTQAVAKTGNLGQGIGRRHCHTSYCRLGAESWGQADQEKPAPERTGAATTPSAGSCIGLPVTLHQEWPSGQSHHIEAEDSR